MTNEERLEKAANIIGDFLADNGALSNGYESWAKGNVYFNTSGCLKIFTPDCENKTYNEVRKLGIKLENLLKPLTTTDISLKVSAKHIEFGAYDTIISIVAPELTKKVPIPVNKQKRKS